MATVKTKAKRHEVIRKGWRADVPKFNIMDYRTSMMKILAHFAAEVDTKEKQAMTIAHWNKEGKNVVGLARLSEGWFNQTGPIVYLLSENVALDEHDQNYLENKYTDLMQRVKELKEEKSVVKINRPQQKRDDSEIQAKKLGSEIDGEIEKAFTAKGKYVFDAKDFLGKAAATANTAKTIATFYKQTLTELKSAQAGTSYDCSEGYAWLGKVGLKRMMEFMQSIIDACNNAAVIAKTTNKVRVRKARPASMIVAKMKYKKEDSLLKMKSITPDKIVGSSELWVFNTQYRKLFRYVAQDEMTLSVKGSTVQNFNPELSGAKTIRKPDEYFTGALLGASKRTWNKGFNEVKSVLAKATGRINEETLLLKVF